MAITPLRALLFIAGALIAGAGTAYFMGAFNPFPQSGGEMEMAAAPDAVAEQEPNAGEADANANAAEESSGELRAEAPEQKVVVPAFDVLRAEPNGSLVVAGRAAPGAEVQILSGSSVLATTEAGPSGDFAAALDSALTPGNHNIVLRATSPEKVVATSVETAVVSVPTAESGPLVALVQQPGEPSRLISVPEPEAPSGSADNTAENGVGAGEDATAMEGTNVAGEPAEAVQEADRAGETAEAVEGAGRASENAAETGEEPAGDAVAEGRSDAGGEPTGERLAAVEPAPERPNAAEEQPATAVETQPRSGSGEASETPAEAIAPEVPAPAETPPAQTEPAETAAARPAETAAARPAETAAATPAETAPAEAVPEEAEQTPTQRIAPFIEAVEIDGREVFVAGRAEPGRRVRVYVEDVLLGETTVGPDGRFLVQTERDLPVGDHIIRADVLGDDGASVIARAAVPFARHSGDRVTSVAADPAPPPAQTPGQTAADTAAPPADPADAPAETAAEPSRDDTSAPGERMVAEARPDAGESAPEIEVEMAPPLQPADGAVIIRRGDTLWHISRRVYGRGMRYTTIYLANQDQIRDPDLIWPGQIFTLPEKTDEGETADFEAIEDQTVSQGDTAGARSE